MPTDPSRTDGNSCTSRCREGAAEKSESMLSWTFRSVGIGNLPSDKMLFANYLQNSWYWLSTFRSNVIHLHTKQFLTHLRWVSFHCTVLIRDNHLCILQGMVLVSPDSERYACREFEADIYVLFHSSRISVGFQTTIHIGTVCQTAVVVQMDRVSVVVLLAVADPDPVLISSEDKLHMFLKGMYRFTQYVYRYLCLCFHKPLRY